jgi:hypothetical protein
MPAPIIVDAVAGATALLFGSSTSIALLTVVPVGMWAKVSIWLRQWWTRIIYYVINSLIIFCVAFGAGNLAATSKLDNVKSVDLVFPSAYAQSASRVSPDFNRTNDETARGSDQGREKRIRLTGEIIPAAIYGILINGQTRSSSLGRIPLPNDSSGGHVGVQSIRFRLSHAG